VADTALRKTLGRMGGRFGLDPTLWLHDLTNAHLDALQRARMKEGQAAQTIAHEIKTIRAATRYAKGRNYRVPDIDRWGLPKLPTKTRFLTWDEWCRLFEALDPATPITQTGRNGEAVSYVIEGGIRAQQRQDAQDLLVALTLCGGRWSEVTSLTWDRIDLAGRTIRIWGSKTQKERVVGVPEQFARVLARRYAERDPKNPLVFPNKRGDKRRGSCRAILRAMDRCGLNAPESVRTMGKATVHSLRHTYASWLLQRGAGLAEVQEALGHTTLQMTRRYAHLQTSERVNKLRALLDQPAA
jgi:integrase